MATGASCIAAIQHPLAKIATANAPHPSAARVNVK
jgi:hypothetical protein